jgi:phosphotransferase system HPr (HPr) family protein
MANMKKTILVRGKQGLHARPAAMFVQIANKYDAQVSVRKDSEEINGKSIMGLLMLGADYNSEITLTIDGPDAEKAMAALEAFVGQEE